MTINTLIIFVFILIALVCYLHYLINKQAKEIDQIWSQVAILVLTTSSKLSELKQELDKIKNDENRK
jgi:hypothetical protein